MNKIKLSIYVKYKQSKISREERLNIEKTFLLGGA